MRQSLLLLLLICSSFSFYAQSNEDISYLDQNLQPARKGKATYIKTMTVASDSSMNVTITFMDKALKMEGQYTLVKGELLEHGKFTYYHHNGQVESEGEYYLGYKTGEWKRFAQSGNALQPRYYSADMGSKLRIHVLSKTDQ